MLALIGCCFIAGVLTRDSQDKDSDHPFMIIMRGLAVVSALAICLVSIAGVIGLIVNLFD